MSITSGAVAILAGCTVSLAGFHVFAANRARVLFSRPGTIDNRYLPLSSLHRDVLVGTDDGGPARIERTRLQTSRTLSAFGQTFKAMTVEERDFVRGALKEVTRDYFAQSDDGTVYYLGEDVDEYQHGRVAGHGGAWLVGTRNARPGVILPSHPKVGDRWMSEATVGVAVERDIVLSTSAAVRTPLGTYTNCVEVKEIVPGEQAEYKYYAKGVGVVREVPASGNMLLISHG